MAEPAGRGDGAPAGFPGRGRRLAGRVVLGCSWLYLAAVLCLWALLHAGDLWWPATLLMFSPRWLLALPPALLAPAAAAFRRRSLGVLLLTLLLVGGPV